MTIFTGPGKPGFWTPVYPPWPREDGRQRGILLVALLGLALLALVACRRADNTPIPAAMSVPAPTLPPTATAAPTPTSVPTLIVGSTPSTRSPSAQKEIPRSVRLPEDEGPHGTPIEWWYFNGHLTDEAGRQYSYHFVAFQTVTSTGLTPQLLQLSWADHPRKLHLTAEKVGFQTAAATLGRFDVQVSDWQMRGDGVNYGLAFDTGGYSLDLHATSLKAAALHDKVGLVNMGPAGDSYYYSRTRLKTSGTLTIDGERRVVTGIAWMDHQWGDFSPVRVGWDWVSLQFHDESELMVSLVWDPTDHRPYITYGTYIAPDAAVQHVDGDEIMLSSTGSWTSPTTGAVYPMGWELRVISLALAVTLTPVQEGAELAKSSYVPAAYWEGAVSVVGHKNGVGVGGKGFVEMVGYDTRQASAEPGKKP